VISHGPDSARSRPGVNSGGTARQAVGRDRPRSASVVNSSISFGPAPPSFLGIRAVLRSSPSARGHCATASALQVRVMPARGQEDPDNADVGGNNGVLEDIPASYKTFASYLPVRALPHRARNDAARGPLWMLEDQGAKERGHSGRGGKSARRPIPRLNRRCRLGAACSFMHDAPLKNTPQRARRHRNH
jgi:hypothetical protein